MLILTAVIAATQCVIPTTESQRLMTLSYEQFDTASGEYGWRQLNGRGCTDSAVTLLTRYGVARSATLSREQRSEMTFHAAQALAFVGRNADAIAPLQRSLELGGTDEWTTYVAANLAFLRKDKPALKLARDRYAGISPGSMRLKFLDGFIACPEADYMTAAYCAP